MKTKIFTLFVALLATTSLWARPFQVGDLYYKIAGDNGVESMPTVSNPGAGRTTVVLYYVPENTPAGCYAVGTVNNWDSNNTDFMFTPIEGAGIGWVACTFDYEPNMQIKVLAIPSDPDFLGWSYQWGKNIDWENDLEEDNVVILGGTGYLELESQGEPKLVGLEDDGVVYVEIKEWASDPYVEPVPCESAAFEHSWGGGDWIYREATKTADATFELNARYGYGGVSVATDIYGASEYWYSSNQIEFVGDVAQGDSVNFKFVSERRTLGRLIVTLIEKGTGSNDEYWYVPSKKSSITPQKRSSDYSTRQVVVTYQSVSSENYAYLTTAYIPETVVYKGKTYEVVGIDDYAFANSPITSITIPNSVTSIGNGAFNGCKSLTSITIPNSVTNIGSGEYNYGCWEGLFSGCSSLKSIIVKEGNPVYDSRNNCNAIVETATNTLVVGCQSTNMPSSITSIGPGAFAGLENLTSIYIPNSVTSIGNAAFQKCNSLKSITIPNSVTSIDNYAFYECEKLGTLVLGDKVNEIGDRAFDGCNKLYHIYCYAPEPPVINEDVFTNYNVNLYVPCNYLDNYKYDRVFGSFRYIQCIDSEDVTTNDVVVTPGVNDVTITWPTEGNADTYTIVIKKDNEVFCTLIFNANGQLLNIAFAPGRDGNHPVQYAEHAGNGYRFTVTSLESATKYGYNIDVKDASNKTIKSHSGEFTTQSTTAVDNITTNNANIQKIMRDGQFIIVRDGVEYNAMGQEM